MRLLTTAPIAEPGDEAYQATDKDFARFALACVDGLALQKSFIAFLQKDQDDLR
jgi:hypothetical protein